MAGFVERLDAALQKKGRVLKENRRPKIGIWYYLPKKTGGWRLWIYSTSDPSQNLSHYEAWQVLAEDLAKEFGVLSLLEELQELPYGIPRGRVDTTDDLVGGAPKGKWFVLHGGDFPLPADGELKKIVSEFDLIHQVNFAGLEVKEVDHEKTDPTHVKRVREILNVD
ncbi:MAG: hypothetical protein Q8K86_10755 [Candidatus Nanopelagicaceae bacterium]|nr:hypothetical protein [Candidatus Nanopelagicaceae bacterium]